MDGDFTILLDKHLGINTDSLTSVRDILVRRVCAFYGVIHDRDMADIGHQYISLIDVMVHILEEIVVYRGFSYIYSSPYYDAKHFEAVVSACNDYRRSDAMCVF